MQSIFFLQFFLRWQSWWQRNACWNWKRRSPSTTRTWTDPSPLKSFPWFAKIYKSELKMQFLVISKSGAEGNGEKAQQGGGERHDRRGGRWWQRDHRVLRVCRPHGKVSGDLVKPLLLKFIFYFFQNLANAEWGGTKRGICSLRQRRERSDISSGAETSRNINSEHFNFFTSHKGWPKIPNLHFLTLYKKPLAFSRIF